MRAELLQSANQFKNLVLAGSGNVNYSALQSLMAVNNAGVLLSVINAVLLVAGAWGRVDHLTLSLWLAASLALYALLRAKSAAAQRYLQSKDPHKPLSKKKIRRVEAFAVIMAGPWIVAPFLMFGTGDPVVEILVMMVSAGMCAGGAVMQHRIPSAAVAYFSSILLAVASASLLFGGLEYIAVAIYALPFGAALLVMTLSTSRIAREREQNLSNASKALSALRAANTELDALRASAEHEALIDELTGLANRRGLSREIERRNRTGAADAAVLHLDLDRFKLINDRLGHAAGDFVLKHVAEVICQETRRSDFLSRIGGDEFIIIIDLPKGPQAAEALARRLVERFRIPVSYKGALCRFSASIGVSLLRPAPDAAPLDLDEILINTDIALYKSKENGRNRYTLLDDDLLSEFNSINGLSDELLEALETGQITPFYQPQFFAADGGLRGVEALARWRHPTRGVLPPGVFLPVAERLNLTAAIDQRILEAALEDLKDWEAQGFVVPKLSVNVSQGRLRSPELLSSLAEMEIPPQRLCFEILENIFSDQVDEQLEQVMRWLDERGVELELDDFGTGHTSLLSLLNFRPKRIKIARELAAPSASSGRHATMVRSVVEIAHSLDIEVIAEGIETKEDVAALTEAGCEVLQGYYFAKPMEAAALIERFASQASHTATG